MATGSPMAFCMEMGFWKAISDATITTTRFTPVGSSNRSNSSNSSSAAAAASAATATQWQQQEQQFSNRKG